MFVNKKKNLLIAALSVAASQVKAETQATQGIYTFYTGPFNAGTCGYRDLVDSLNYNFVAVQTKGGGDVMMNGVRCGQCVEVCMGDPEPCRVFHVVDSCPECESNHLDIASPAFEKMKAEMVQKTGKDFPGKGEMKMRWVDCSKSANPFKTIKIVVLEYKNDVFQFGIAADNGIYGAEFTGGVAKDQQQSGDKLALQKFGGMFFAYQLTMKSNLYIGDFSKLSFNIVCNGQVGGASAGKTIPVTIDASQLSKGKVIDTGMSCSGSSEGGSNGGYQPVSSPPSYSNNNKEETSSYSPPTAPNNSGGGDTTSANNNNEYAQPAQGGSTDNSGSSLNNFFDIV